MKISKPKHFLYLTTALILLPAAHGFALDNNTTPVGEQVVAGTATFDRPAIGRLDITQSSNRVIINWDRFDIGNNATTHFSQPNSAALAVNRVTGPDNNPTQILGTLESNGQLMILDQNGILFGKNATIDVGGIIASTGDVIDGDITGSSDPVEILGADDNFVENKGRITVDNAGLAAFVAPVVRNSGIINAKLGRIEMASGGASATVDLYGDGLIELATGGNAQQNLLDNAGKMIAEGGTIALTTAAAQNFANALINVSGIVSVSSAQNDGGKIILRGENVTITPSGRLEADSANDHGGEIEITLSGKANINGALTAQGKKSGGAIDITRGEGITIGQQARINTSSLEGNGGDINIGAESGLATMNGHLTSSGATGGGLINLENGDDPFSIGKSARILSEARNSGSGGDIDVSSAEGTHNIAGRLITRGAESGGNIDVSSRSGLNLSSDSLLETRATQGGQGGNIRLFGGELMNYDGRVISAGLVKGGNITMQADEVFMSQNSTLESRSPNGTGGNIEILANSTQTRGLIASTGKLQGGNIFLGNQDLLTVFETSRINSNGTGTQGKGGTIFVGADGTSIAGDITANGKAGGGNVKVYGTSANIRNTSSILAKATQKGTGGKITVESGLIGFVNGTLDVSGKDGGGQIDVLYDDDLSLGASSRLLAQSVATGTGGVINITALFHFLQNKGSIINASGANGGGTIAIRSFDDLVAAGEIRADAKRTGNGGDIDLISDNGSVLFSGHIFARGGSLSGNGGDVFFSSPNSLLPGSSVDVSAPNGSDGSFTH